MQQTIDDAEVVVQKALPDEQREKSRNRPGDENQRPVGPLESQSLLVQDDREEQADEEGEEDDGAGEEDGPDEDLEERPSVLRVGEDLAEVVSANVRLPAGLELLAPGDERSLAAVAEDRAVAQPRERVVLRVVAERGLELGGGRD